MFGVDFDRCIEPFFLEGFGDSSVSLDMFSPDRDAVIAIFAGGRSAQSLSVPTDG